MTPGVEVDAARRTWRTTPSLPMHPRLAALADAGVEVPDMYVSYALGPLMHVSGHWSAWGAMLSGGLHGVAPEPPNGGGDGVGDGGARRGDHADDCRRLMGLPLVETLEADPGRFDTTSVLMLGSGGSIMSGDVKDRLLVGFPSAMMIVEAIGSSESPAQAMSTTVRGRVRPRRCASWPTRGRRSSTTICARSSRGQARSGRLATMGRVPVGYYNDPEKTARTFVTVDGERWALPGDMASIEADLTIRLLGRGTLCINTGGEKVYPEEVEAVLKAYDRIVDAVIVGVPDPRFGERVAAVAEPVPGGSPLTLEEVQHYCRGHLAGHKVPRQLFIVDKVPRTPSGKADYTWAKEVARSGDSALEDA